MSCLLHKIPVYNAESYCAHINSAVFVHIAYDKISVAEAAELMLIIAYLAPCLTLVLRPVKTYGIIVCGLAPYEYGIRIAVRLALPRPTAIQAAKESILVNVLPLSVDT